MSTEQSNPSVSMVQGPSGLVPTNVNPQAPGGIRQVGPTQAQGVAPGAQPVVDAYGRTSVFNPQGNTTTPIGTGPGGARPSSFTQPVPQQAQIEQEVEGTRKADADYGVNRHVNEQILRLSSDTKTGPGTDIWHHALGAVAGAGGGNNVSDYQTIGAYLDRQAAMSTRQMGLPDTNAGLATAASLSGTTSYQPKALQTKVKLTDALVEGAHQYRMGLDKVIGTGPNQDLAKYQAYRSAWAENFDPTVFLLENAHKRGDKAETTSILNSLTPEQAKALQQKRRNLNALASGKLQ